MSGCGYAELDGSYVLGALSPVERQEFERHLDTCADCARSVRELAGLPGLLGRVDPVILEPGPPPGPVPATLLPSLVREVARARRRRLFASVGVAAAAAVAAVSFVLVSGVVGGTDTPSANPPTTTPSTAVPVGQAMSPVGHVPVTGTLAFTPVAWGTRIDLTCSYEHAAGSYHAPSSVTYGLFVVNRDGSAQQVGTWRALDGQTMRVTAATAAQRSDIAGVEVRTADGRPVLRLKA